MSLEFCQLHLLRGPRLVVVGIFVVLRQRRLSASPVKIRFLQARSVGTGKQNQTAMPRIKPGSDTVLAESGWYVHNIMYNGSYDTIPVPPYPVLIN